MEKKYINQYREQYEDVVVDEFILIEWKKINRVLKNKFRECIPRHFVKIHGLIL